MTKLEALKDFIETQKEFAEDSFLRNNSENSYVGVFDGISFMGYAKIRNNTVTVLFEETSYNCLKTVKKYFSTHPIITGRVLKIQY